MSGKSKRSRKVRTARGAAPEIMGANTDADIVMDMMTVSGAGPADADREPDGYIVSHDHDGTPLPLGFYLPEGVSLNLLIVHVEAAVPF